MRLRRGAQSSSHTKHSSCSLPLPPFPALSVCLFPSIYLHLSNCLFFPPNLLLALFSFCLCLSVCLSASYLHLSSTLSLSECVGPSVCEGHMGFHCLSFSLRLHAVGNESATIGTNLHQFQGRQIRQTKSTHACFLLSFTHKADSKLISHSGFSKRGVKKTLFQNLT